MKRLRYPFLLIVSWGITDSQESILDSCIIFKNIFSIRKAYKLKGIYYLSLIKDRVVWLLTNNPNICCTAIPTQQSGNSIAIYDDIVFGCINKKIIYTSVVPEENIPAVYAE